MLKVTGDSAPSGDERSIGKLATQLVDDAKAYARAELDYAKAVGADKSKYLRTSAILVTAALFLAMGALNALCVAIFVALATLIGPLLAGIVAFVLIGAVAAIVGWIGVQKFRDAL
jgi:multisubunit Na+/H+ antiporter MnhG subunit